MQNKLFERRSFELTSTCEYLVHVPDGIDDRTLLIITLHGYGSNPTDMLRLTMQAVGRQHIIAALQAPNQHYAAAPGVDAPSGYNWGIRQHWEQAVTLHHRILQGALSRLRADFGMGPERTVLMGFSQPVGLNYRFVGTHPGLVRGVIGICGGVPRDWDESKYGNVDASILHISREEDEFYAVEVARQFPDRLRRHASDVEFHLMPGGHRFPSKSSAVIQPWLNRVFR